MKQYAEKFYKSKKWQKVRAIVWTRDRGLCQRCLRNGIIKAGDTVHHIEAISPETITDESIALNPENLETLCRDCHAAVHKREKRWTVDELGRITAIDTMPLSVETR